MHGYISHRVLQLSRHRSLLFLARLRFFIFSSVSVCVVCVCVCRCHFLFPFCRLSCRLHESNLAAYLWHSLTFVLVDGRAGLSGAGLRLRWLGIFLIFSLPLVSFKLMAGFTCERSCYRFTWRRTDGRTGQTDWRYFFPLPLCVYVCVHL